jgi:hypothetical protein
MAWLATERYGLDSAPGGLAFVQDLLNTFSAGKPREPDLLDDLGAAQGWLTNALSDWSEVTGRQAPSVELGDRDLEELHVCRDELRRLIGQPTDAAPSEDSRDMPILPVLTVAVRLDGNRVIHTEPAGAGWRKVASLALIECFEAQQTDVLRRLKICRNRRCGSVFFDRSRNNSGVWHDVRTCGNAANLRAHRARKRTQSGGSAEGPSA